MGFREYECEKCGHPVARDMLSKGYMHFSIIGVEEIFTKKCKFRGCKCITPSFSDQEETNPEPKIAKNNELFLSKLLTYREGERAMLDRISSEIIGISNDRIGLLETERFILFDDVVALLNKIKKEFG